MQKYIDPTKITYMDSTEEMKKYYFWYYSKEKESYVSSTGVHERCGRFCEEDHPYYWSNIPFHDHYNLTESRQSEDAIGCFGCSVTFGAQLPEHKTWPFLLGKKLQVPCVNFGVCGAGIDSIFLNLKASLKDYSFKKVVINLPAFARRVGRISHNGLWFRWPIISGDTGEYGKLLDPPIHSDLNLNMQKFKEHSDIVMKKIVKDVESVYSKNILKRMIKFCRNNYKEFYITSWNTEVYTYLKKHYNEHTILMYDLGGLTTRDGIHPVLEQNKRFVDNMNY